MDGLSFLRRNARGEIIYILAIISVSFLLPPLLLLLFFFALLYMLFFCFSSLIRVICSYLRFHVRMVRAFILN